MNQLHLVLDKKMVSLFYAIDTEEAINLYKTANQNDALYLVLAIDKFLSLPGHY